MTENERFLRIICEYPCEDAPRLAYADWLEEQGHVRRAEFIRVQVALASLPPDAPQRDQLWWRETQFLVDDAATWKKKLPRRDGVNWGELKRGFVRTLEHTAGNHFAAEAPILFEAAPIEVLRLARLSPQALPTVLEVPQLCRLQLIHLALPRRAWWFERSEPPTPFGDPEAIALLRCPHLGPTVKVQAVWQAELDYKLRDELNRRFGVQQVVG